ncbi:hypothetical protein B566_EDAN016133 [Ephemera danica]|nr:hypothetical protein B566_EDAN016133 [Ephemera danica]
MVTTNNWWIHLGIIPDFSGAMLTLWTRLALLLLLVLSENIHSVHGTLSQSDKRSKDTKNIKTFEGPVADDIVARGVATKNPKVKDLIAHHAAYQSNIKKVNFQGTVLGYVTPWNSKGYDVAQVFAPKFGIISPVWLQVRRETGGTFRITGDHDIDQGWIEKLRKHNKKLKIIPRVLFEGWSGQDYSKVLTDSQEQQQLAKSLVEICQRNSFDGLVLELWSQLGGRVNEPLAALVQRLAKALRESGRTTILVLPPVSGRPPEIFDKIDFDRLVNDVDYFSLMTYDFSSVQRPGPSSPLPWIRSCVEQLVPDQSDPHRSKILLGLNFYGQDFTPNGGGPILGNQFIDLLKKAKSTEKMKHDESAEENFIEIRTNEGRHAVFYPTPYSVQKRINLARELGTGVSIWELGQGLDCFYDLL